MPLASSSRRYAQYRQRLKERTGGKGAGVARKPGDAAPPRARSFGSLLWQFLRLLQGNGWAVGFALGTLTVATVLKLVPPLATKLVIDNVLGDHPLPAIWTQWLRLPTDRFQLLYTLGRAWR